MRFGDLVLFNDHQLIAVNKPATVPTQEDKSGDTSLHRMAQAYSKRDLHVTHRLDRPCSGLVLFAKNPNAAAAISKMFAEGTIGKYYYAVVPKGIDPQKGALTHNLAKGHGNKVYVTGDDGEGKEAVLEYRVVGEIDNYALLGVITKTGRMHQIRAQLGHVGFPIKGDVKYGARRGNRDRSIHLHSHSITFVHPTKHEKVTITCPLPDDPVWNAFELPELKK